MLGTTSLGNTSTWTHGITSFACQVVVSVGDCMYMTIRFTLSDHYSLLLLLKLKKKIIVKSKSFK